MTPLQRKKLFKTIADRSSELYTLIQSVEGHKSSEAWLSVFQEITKAWFEDDLETLSGISDFVHLGTHFSPPDAKDLYKMVFGPGPLTNH